MTSAAKLAGGLKVMVTARFFGTSDALDAFLIAFLIPSFVSSVIAGSFTPSLIPQLVQAQTARGTEAAHRLVRGALGFSVGLMLMATALLALTGRWLLPLAGSSFSAQKLHLATALFFGLLFWLPMSACIATWRAVLNADNRFALAAIAPLATPVVTIAALFTFAARFGVAVLCIGTVVGVLVECAALGVAVHRMGYSLRPSWSGWRMPELRTLQHQYFPLAASGIITSGCIVADQVVAGRLSPGSVSAWTYGTKLSTVILAIAAAAASAVVLPAFSQLAATQNWRRLRNSVRLYCGVALLLSLPTAAFLIAASGPIVRIFFEHGEFQASAAELVAHIQRFALIEVPFTLLLAIVARLASALSANRLLLWMGGAALVTDIVLDIVLSRMMGVAGIALASAAVEMVSFLVLVILLYQHSPQAFREVKA